MIRPIAISIAPNMEIDDVFLALKKIINPFNYIDSTTKERFELKFADFFGKKYKVLTTDSGRSALYLILKALEIGEQDEVIVQAFTCSAAVNPIIWNGAKPIYSDINDTYNIDPEDVESKITKKTRAIIVQHTFGIPANIKKINEIAKRHDLLMIEDCAVSLGATVNDQPVGSFGDVSFFSFGRDKIISSVWGGAVVTRDKKIFEKIKKEYDQLSFPSRFWIFQQLFHPIAFSLILPTYNLGFGKLTIGKLLVVLFQKLGLLSIPVSDKEKEGQKPDNLPKKFPGALAAIAINQFNKLDRYIYFRKKTADIYRDEIKNDDILHPPEIKGSVWLRYPIKVNDASSLLTFAKKRGVLLGDWYKQSIYPIKDLKYVSYEQDCKFVEGLKNKVINLPTYPTMNEKDIEKIIKLIKRWQKSK